MLELNAETTSPEFKRGWKAAKRHEDRKSRRVIELEEKLSKMITLFEDIKNRQFIGPSSIEKIERLIEEGS